MGGGRRLEPHSRDDSRGGSAGNHRRFHRTRGRTGRDVRPGERRASGPGFLHPRSWVQGSDQEGGS
eukprot:8489232-Heterocapsa_arctica.AAC.1